MSIHLRRGKHRSAQRADRTARPAARWTAFLVSALLLAGAAVGMNLQLPEANAAGTTGFNNVWYDPSETPTNLPPNTPRCNANDNACTLTPQATATGVGAVPLVFHADFTEADNIGAGVIFGVKVPAQFKNCSTATIPVYNADRTVQLGTATFSAADNAVEITTNGNGTGLQNISGSIFWQCGFINTPPNQTTNWTFGGLDGSGTWSFNVVPTEHDTGGTVDETQPVKIGAFNDPNDQGRNNPKNAIIWTMFTSVDPHAGFEVTDTLPANQSFDCTTLEVSSATPTPGTRTGLASKTVVSPPVYTVNTCNGQSLDIVFNQAPPAGSEYLIIIKADLPAPTGPDSIETFTNSAHFTGDISTSTGTQHVDTSAPFTIKQDADGAVVAGDHVTLHKFDKNLGLPNGEFDAAPGESVPAHQPVQVAFLITNTGTTTLTNINVTDSTINNTTGAVTGLDCGDFGGFGGSGTTATTAPNAQLPSGASFTCYGTLPGLPAGVQHSDLATVTATGNGSIGDTNPFNATTPPAPSMTTTFTPPANNHTGSPAVDTVDVTNMPANGTATLNWTLYYAANATDCTQVDWANTAALATFDSGSQNLTADASGHAATTVTTANPTTGAGCYSFADSITLAGSQTPDVSIAAGTPSETLLLTLPVPTQPTVATQVGPTTGLVPGGTISDSFSVTGLGANNPVTVNWSLKLFPNATTCVGLNWSDPSVTQVDGGTKDIPGDVPAASPVSVSSSNTTGLGCYTFVWTVPATTSAGSSTSAYTTSAGDPTESTVAATQSATVTTQISQGSVTGTGATVSDSVHVTGSNGVPNGTYTAKLYGPVTAPPGATDCSQANWATASVFDTDVITVNNGDATYSTKNFTVPAASASTWQCYSFGGDFGGSLSGTFAPGDPTESLLVAPVPATMTTDISPTTGAPGVQPTDTVHVSGLNGPVALDWTLASTPAVNGSCTGADWSNPTVVASSQSPMQVGNGDSTITLPAPLTAELCYSFKDVLHAPAGAITVNYGDPRETILVSRTAATATTTASTHSLPAGGGTVSDSVVVTNSNGTQGSYTATLYGPVTVPQGSTDCSLASWTNAPVADTDTSLPITGDNTYTTKDFTIGAAPASTWQCYSFGGNFTGGLSGSLAPGVASESVLVTPAASTFSTNIAPTSGAPGVIPTDTVHVSGLGASEQVDVDWTLASTPVVNGSCTGADWSNPTVVAGPATVKVGNGDSVISPNAAATQPACYSFRDVFHAPTGTVTVDYGNPSETMLVSPTGATATTSATPGSLTASGNVHDAVTVAGSNNVAGDWNWTLYGPVDMPAGTTSCANVTAAQYQAAGVVATNHIAIDKGDNNGTAYVTPDVAVSTPAGKWSCYGYGGSFSGGLTGTVDPGAANESVLVSPTAATMSTQASPSSGQPGVQPSDAITVTGLPANSTADLDWYLGYVQAVNNSCTGVDWSNPQVVASSGQTPVKVDNNGTTINPNVTLTNAGCYSFRDVLHAPTGDVESNYGVPAETVLIAPNALTVTTQVAGGALADPVQDSLSVSGLGANNPVTAHWSLKLFPSATTCTGLNWSDPSVKETDAGDQNIPGDVSAAAPVTVSSTKTTELGCYTFVWSLPATSNSDAYVSAAGLPSESLVLSPSTATATTVATPNAVTGSGTVHDAVTVTGSKGLQGGWSWRLYGPVAMPVGTTSCASVTAAQFTAAGVFAANTIGLAAGDNGGQPYPTQDVTVATPPSTWSCYGYAGDFTGALTGSVAPGAANEWVLVSPTSATMSTVASPVTGAPGAQPSDAVTVANLGTTGATPNTAQLDWELWHTADVNGVCTGADWTAPAATKIDSGSQAVPDGVTTITPKALAANKGCYSFKDVLHAPTGDVTSALGVVSETFYIAANVPTAATTVSATGGEPGDKVHDTVTVNGAGGATVPVVSTLYRLDMPKSGVCDASNTALDWTKATAVPEATWNISVVDGQTGSTPDVTLTVPGCYSFGTVIQATGSTAAATLPPGNVTETAMVTALIPTVTTVASPQTAMTGDKVHDTVTVGNTRGAKVDVTWTLLGPVMPGASGCGDAIYSDADAAATGHITANGDGKYLTPDVTVTRAGCYTYVQSLASTDTSAAVTTKAAEKDETILVAVPPTPAVPPTSLAFTGAADLPSLLGVTVVLLGGGALLLLMGRRRRNSHS